MDRISRFTDTSLPRHQMESYVLLAPDEFGTYYESKAFSTPEEACEFRDFLAGELDDCQDSNTQFLLKDAIKQLSDQLYEYEERLAIIEFDS